MMIQKRKARWRNIVGSVKTGRYQSLWEIKMYIKQTSEYVKWFDKLKDERAQAKIAIRLRRIQETDNLADWKSLKDGIGELRIDYGPGYRIYFAKRGLDIILLLAGGDKSSQEADIAKAKKINESNP